MDRRPGALCEYLKEKRDLEGIDQREQARKLEISPEELSRYVTGKRQLKKDLQKIINVYGTTDLEKIAIYRTQVTEEEIQRAERLISETRAVGEFIVTPIDLVVWIKYGI